MLQGEIQDMIEVMRDDIKQSMMDHHFEMIKQFYLMQVRERLMLTWGCDKISI